MIICTDFDGRPTMSLVDDVSGKLEARMVEIAAGNIVEGEAKFRRGVAKAHEQQ